MKKAICAVAAALLIACNSPKSIPTVQVEYDDGRIENVNNPENISLKPLDTVVIRYYSSNTTLYSSRDIYGKYRGIIRDASYDSMYIMTYSKAIVLKINIDN